MIRQAYVSEWISKSYGVSTDIRQSAKKGSYLGRDDYVMG